MPRKLYGGRDGTKIDVIIDTILRYAKDNNLKVDKKLPEGEVREDILNKITPYMQTLDEMVDAFKRFIEQGKEIREVFIPENEPERKLFKSLCGDLALIKTFVHALGQNIALRGVILKNHRKRKEKSSKDEEEQK